MNIDEEIDKAVREVTKEYGQPEAVALRLIAWLNDAASRDVPVTDLLEHLTNVRNAVELEEN